MSNNTSQHVSVYFNSCVKKAIRKKVHSASMKNRGLRQHKTEFENDIMTLKIFCNNTNHFQMNNRCFHVLFNKPKKVKNRIKSSYQEENWPHFSFYFK